MYPEVRMALVALALLAAAAAGFFAQKIIAGNVRVAKTWTKVQARVNAMPALDHVEIELPGDPDPTLLILAPTHSLGLSIGKKVPVYIDPNDSRRARFGGLFQMWLWPAALATGVAICLMATGALARVGAGETGDGWHASAPPPPIDTDIRVRPPASEVKAPIFWSILGLAALGLSILSRKAAVAPRAGLAVIGGLFMLAMWAKALENRTTEIRADAQRIRKSSAFGWIEAPWERIARVERTEVIPDERTPGFMLYRQLPFPGRRVEAYAFVDRNGWTMFSMSLAMGPMDPMHRLLDLCREKTGSTLERKTIRAPFF
jgi:hypothetical protein